MRISLAGIPLVSPVIAASGSFGYGVEFEDVVALDRIGGFVTKGLSALPMAGNAAPRIVETPGGMINAIGLQNVGVDRFLTEKLPALARYPSCAVIANVFGYEVADYLTVIRALNSAEGIAAYELNASCPNTAHGGITFGTDWRLLRELVVASVAAARRPVIVKLSPNVTSISAMARCAEDAGAAAVSLVNTFLSLAIDIKTRRPKIANVTGGLSGPAIKPIAVRMVWEAAQAIPDPDRGHGRDYDRRGCGRVSAGWRDGGSRWAPRATLIRGRWSGLPLGWNSGGARNHVDRVAELTGKLDASKPVG